MIRQHTASCLQQFAQCTVTAITYRTSAMHRPLLALLAAAWLSPTWAAAPIPEWREGDGYLVGVAVQYQGQTYKALQSHTAHKGTNWNPAGTPALWQLQRDPVQRCAPWQEGAAYQVGDKVRYEGGYYRAQQAHTAYQGTGWFPPKVPALWQPITQCDAVTPVPPGNGETINGIKVPPDPGAEGRRTLAGIDSDNDGVRDDVQRFLAKEVGQHPARFRYAMEMARITQQEILAASENNKEKVRSLFSQWIVAHDCYFRTYKDSVELYSWRLNFSKKLTALHSNTPERIAANNKADELASGKLYRSPIKANCD
ncbi:hypothetical protein N8I74_00335 [Chitiniphilus purpureus]|uniref:Chitin-binding type-3 domain-containing protein n=1 Tax=Chitiniphilus purpureus TaxID=2981137 RepID=A0ABY6DMR3_9NEIS|nr:carbohydrate-binding protein [Chitiniphilus sp. CD1]UXY15498.1 hypothetical protein N8I74_00335 [Chitiniphilus sp. CD1]